MFYCDPCAEPRGWPTDTLMTSYGACEICRKTGVCNDVPSRFLPMPPIAATLTRAAAEIPATPPQAGERSEGDGSV